jgi:urease accessory protein
MLKIFEKLEHKVITNKVLTLPFELRQKSRLKTQLGDGTEVGLMLPRGLILRGGDCLRAEDGSIIRVVAAAESVSTVRHQDLLSIARVSYHLGNRHVSLQIGDGWLRYQHDHVLDDMVRGFGLEVIHEIAPFEPEGGAYGDHEHHHGHLYHEHPHDGHSH